MALILSRIVSSTTTAVVLAAAAFGTAHAETVTYDIFLGEMLSVQNKITEDTADSSGVSSESHFVWNGIQHTAQYRWEFNFDRRDRLDLYMSGRFTTPEISVNVRCVGLTCWIRPLGETQWKRTRGRGFTSVTGMPSPYVEFMKYADADTYDITENSFTTTFTVGDPPAIITQRETYLETTEIRELTKVTNSGAAIYSSVFTQRPGQDFSFKSPPKQAQYSNLCFRLWYDTGDWIIGDTSTGLDCTAAPS